MQGSAIQARCLLGSIALCLLLAGCGGGSSNSASALPPVGSSSSSGAASATLSVAPSAVAVAASVSNTAPTATITAQVAAGSGTSYYLSTSSTSNGIASVAAPSTVSGSGAIDIRFKDPATLGPGVYSDTVGIKACSDQACTQQIGGSPASVTVTYTVTDAPPTIATVSPGVAMATGAALNITVAGSRFSTQSTVDWNGTPIPTTFVSPTMLTAVIPASDFAATGSQLLTVASGSQISNTVTFQVVAAAAPTISSLSPPSATVGGAAFTLTVNGTNFVGQSVVNWNGAPRATTVVSPTSLTIEVAAADIAAAANVPVTVTNVGASANQSLPSNAQNFQIAPPAQLSLTALFPLALPAGSPGATLIATGTGFGASAVMLWNGADLPTTFVSSTQLRATVPASDLASVGTANVAVRNGAPSSAVSGALAVKIENTALNAVSLQITPGHSGVMNFQSASLPTAPLWSVSVGGTPSYALIADGIVVITVAVTGGTELLALSQDTGATVWGPIFLGGSAAAAAYENGAVFVINGNVGSTGLMQGFDAATGAVLWSTALTSQYAFTSGVTALNGIAYTGGTGSGGTVYAVNEADGTLLWQAYVANGDDSDPAVTADGVYVNYPCQVYDLAPTTGNLAWNNNSGCDGGGGGTAVVANGLVYAPSDNGGSSGLVLDAGSGATVGSFAASTLPAIGTTNGFFLQSGTLRGLTLANNTVLWSFAGDGQLATAPILVNQYVFIGSASGRVYGLDAATGSQLWQMNVGSAIGSSPQYSGGIPYYALAAGHGLLVVPSANTVTAYRLSANP